MLRHKDKGLRHTEKSLRHTDKCLRHTDKGFRHTDKDLRHTDKGLIFGLSGSEYRSSSEGSRAPGVGFEGLRNSRLRIE
jgi:hypothetical protein